MEFEFKRLKDLENNEICLLFFALYKKDCFKLTIVGGLSSVGDFKHIIRNSPEYASGNFEKRYFEKQLREFSDKISIYDANHPNFMTEHKYISLNKKWHAELSEYIKSNYPHAELLAGLM